MICSIYSLHVMPVVTAGMTAVGGVEVVVVPKMTIWLNSNGNIDLTYLESI